jgi:hypothetical protein
MVKFAKKKKYFMYGEGSLDNGLFDNLNNVFLNKY